MKYENKFKVNITDVDKDNKIKTSSIIKYLQEIGAMQSDSIKDGLYYLEETKAYWILINWKIKIYKRLRWNDIVIAKTWARKTEKVYSYRDYEITDEQGERVAIASAKWVLLDLKDNSLTIPTKELLDRYLEENTMVFDKEIKKIREPEEKELMYSYQIQKRDIDFNNHMNNSNYMDLAEEALEEDSVIDEVEILYKNACKKGDIVNVFYTKCEKNDIIITIKNKETEITNAIIKIKLLNKKL